MSKNETDCKNTSNIICPYCGCNMGGDLEFFSFERNGETDNFECDDCGKSFEVDFNVTYDFTSKKLEE